MALESSALVKDLVAIDFKLLGVDGNYHTLNSIKGKNGFVVAFICNHCPYVKAIIDKITKTANTLREIDVGFVAINSNDVDAYPDDSYENMKIFANEHHFNFPYLIDTTQEIARKYDAMCTPDFFGFNADSKLQYRGRLDSARKDFIPDAKCELLIAMKEIASTGNYSGEQFPSIGCSIKWKAN